MATVFSNFPDDLTSLIGEGIDEKTMRKSRRLAAYWMEQIAAVEDDKKHKQWLKRGDTIEKRYRDERVRTDEDSIRRYASLWSNVEILLPAIYGRCPVPIAERRFRDKDPVGRGAAQILERALRNEIEICNFDQAVFQSVKDYLLPGRGTVWVRYEPEIEQGLSITDDDGLDIHDDQGDIVDDESPDLDKLRDTGDRIMRESTPVDYVHWKDFFTFPHDARTWSEVAGVSRRVWMTNDQVKRRFGEDIAKALPKQKLTTDQRRNENSQPSDGDKSEVFEIWSAADKRVYWVCRGYDFLLDVRDDFLGLDKFFPCPRPIFANATNSTLIPTPDYMEYQDQAVQIDELTARIAMLSRACKVAGVYNAAARPIKRLLDESVENELIPVDDWAAFAEKGGVAGNLSFLPLKEIMGVINELYMIKEKQIQEMDRLTGINDIMRGTSDARETLGGVRLKSNNTGTRLQRRQNDVARYCKEIITIIAQIMAMHFSDKSLIEASGALYEEGLGQIDAGDAVDAMQNQGAQSQPPQMLPGRPGPAPTGMSALPAQVGPGTNIVPFPGGQPQMAGAQPQNPLAAAIPQPSPQQTALQQAFKRIKDAIELIRNQKLLGFRVDIEVDSTIYSDMQQDKQDRTEFIAAVTKYMQQAMQLAQAVPEAAPLLGKMLQFGVRGYKVGRDLEATIEDFCDEAVNVAKQKAQQAAQKPNPLQTQADAAMLKAQTAAKATEAKIQQDGVKTQTDQAKTQADMANDQRQADAEIQRQVIENQGEQANNQADLQMKMMEMEMKNKDMEIEKLRMEVELVKLRQAHVQALNPPQEASLGNEEKKGAA